MDKLHVRVYLIFKVIGLEVRVGLSLKQVCKAELT